MYGVSLVQVAALADEPSAAGAPAHRVARPLPLRRTVARLHAVVAEVTLRAELRAVVPGVPGRAAAVAVAGAAGGAGRAAARLRAVGAPPPRAARQLAPRPAPAQRTLALASNMMTICIIFAIAFFFTIFPICA